MEDQLVGQVVNHIGKVCLDLLDVEVLDALMVGEVGTGILLVADLAHDSDLGALELDVVVELGPCHVLELITIADVTSEFRAMELCMSLKLTQGLPDDWLVTLKRWTSVRELTEIDTVLQDFVDRLKEIAPDLTVRAADIEVWRGARLRCPSWRCRVFPSISPSRDHLALQLLTHVGEVNRILRAHNLIHLLWTLAKLELAVLAEELVAALALHGLVRELLADDALNFLNHLSLQLVLDLVHLDVERRDWLRTHQLLDGPLGDRQVKSLIDTESLLLRVHLLEDGMDSPLLLVHLLDRHNLRFSLILFYPG